MTGVHRTGLCNVPRHGLPLANADARQVRARDRRHIVVDGSGAATIPVIATFTGVRGLPWWCGFAINKPRPLRSIDIQQAVGTVNLELGVHGKLLTFSAHLRAIPLAAHMLRFFPASVPLSARAVLVRDGVS